MLRTTHKPHWVILGAGISGLTLAWYLEKYLGEAIKITLVDKTSRTGGWIRTDFHNGFLFEKGPRGCRSSGTGEQTLQLIEEVDLKNQLISSNEHASKRYLWRNHKLQEVTPYGPLGLPICLGILRDLLLASKAQKEETIYEFALRRFGKSFADIFIDPFVLGIYAGDSKLLSMQACFPRLLELEKKHGSVIKGLIKSKKRDKQPPLFSLKKGMEELTETLRKKSSATFLLNTRIFGFRNVENEIALKTQDDELIADHIISTIPMNALADILSLSFSIPMGTVNVISVGFKKNVFSKKGFGYLVPTSEKEKILGMVWDSQLFPQQNQSENETRLTVMARDSCDVQEVLNRHLGITDKPDYLGEFRAQEAIPHYGLGHHAMIKRIEEVAKKVYPRLTLMNKQGVSVNDCVATAKELAKKLQLEYIYKIC